MGATWEPVMREWPLNAVHAILSRTSRIVVYQYGGFSPPSWYTDVYLWDWTVPFNPSTPLQGFQ